MYFLPFIGIGAPCHSIDSWFSRGPPGLDIGAQEYDAHQRLPSLLGAFDHLAARGSEKAWKGKKTQGEKQPVGWKGNKGVPLPVIHVVQTYPYYKWPYNPAYIYNIYIYRGYNTPPMSCGGPPCEETIGGRLKHVDDDP